MEFSPEQQRAIDYFAHWMREPAVSSSDQVKSLHGCAGTGKTTLAKYLAAQCDGKVLFAAYTGKAAYVMRSKGCTDAKTVHSLIYKPAGEAKSAVVTTLETRVARQHELIKTAEAKDLDQLNFELQAMEAQLHHMLGTEKRKPMFTLNMDSALYDAKLLIIDECSMIDEEIARDLESFGVKILALGDPAQLPPVGAGGYYTNRRPDQMLTEVHRQARESGILRLATAVREGSAEWLTPREWGSDCRVLSRAKMDPQQLRDLVMGADQVLVGKNATRHSANARYRELDGRKLSTPEQGDKIVCLRNNHKAGLLNGSLWRVHEADADDSIMEVAMVISSEEDGLQGVPVVSHSHHFVGREEDLRRMGWGRSSCEEFDYGYALTVHKAQGSQWEDVVLFDESGVFRADKARWLYTGITRASKQLTVIV